MQDSFELQKYKKGSYITVEGQSELDCFYIIKTGSVERCVSRFLMNNKAARKCRLLVAGDVFGVISCMARRPRVEAVMALEDTSVIIVKRDNFEALIQKQPEIAMKIIRHFSKQLRYHDSIIAGMNSQSPPELMMSKDPDHLYTAGEYYLKNKNYLAAGYALIRYIQYSDVEKKIREANKMLQKISAFDPAILPVEPSMDEHFYYYKKDQPVFMEGEIGEELYVIQSGNVRITKLHKNREVLLNVLHLGDIFGEMAILEHKTRNSSAIAADEVKLMPVTHYNFEYMVRNHSSLITRIFEILADRLWLAFFQIANHFISDPETKIYDALYTQLLKCRVRIEKDVPCTFDFTIDDLLNFTGLPKGEGETLVHEILKNNPHLFVNKDGKLACDDVSDILRRINVIKRDSEIEKNIRTSGYNNLLDKDVK